MKERPIIFNAEMVRAILDGRKTQTRRLVPAWQLPKHYPDNTENPRYNWMATAQRHRRWGYGVFGETEEACAKELSEMAPCPFGSAGNRLWVRETFRVHSRATDVATLVYRASERNSWTEQTHRVPVSACDKPVSPEKWTPSLHMPRWASRLVLEITDVRVERLNNISEEDALAEGIRRTDNNFGNGPAYCDYMLANLNDVAEWYNRPSDSFISLWQSIYGAESWQHSPWVWVIEFKRVESQV